MSHSKSEANAPRAMSRRVFLHRGTALIGGTALAATFLGCGGSEEPAGFACSTGLNPTQTNLRSSMSYTDTGADPAKLCKDCNFFPANAPTTACGDCSLGLGAVHPMGSCTSFVART
ncbi:MAG: hypothetical protein R3B40_03570 [Polyangiales bacterium]|nr:hypothetical protein [Myxococcales bacterium]MCB9661196.1 hypothetical protein [Sandaracinaceae bacterium]